MGDEQLDLIKLEKLFGKDIFYMKEIVKDLRFLNTYFGSYQSNQSAVLSYIGISQLLQDYYCEGDTSLERNLKKTKKTIEKYIKSLKEKNLIKTVPGFKYINGIEININVLIVNIETLKERYKEYKNSDEYKEYYLNHLKYLKENPDVVYTPYFDEEMVIED